MTGLAGHRTLAAEGARSSSATALTEVELIWIEKSIEYWVRFGNPLGIYVNAINWSREMSQ